MSALTRCVDRGLEIVAQIAALKDELSVIQEAIIGEGLMRPDLHEPLVDADREGRQFLARGATLAVPVVFTSDLLMSSFPPDGDAHRVLAGIAGEKLPQFFAEARKFERQIDSGKIFRSVAAEMLGKDAPAFVTASVSRNKKGIAKSAIRIEWERAAAAEKLRELAEGAT